MTDAEMMERLRRGLDIMRKLERGEIATPEETQQLSQCFNDDIEAAVAAVTDPPAVVMVMQFINEMEIIAARRRGRWPFERDADSAIVALFSAYREASLRVLGGEMTLEMIGKAKEEIGRAEQATIDRLKTPTVSGPVLRVFAPTFIRKHLVQVCDLCCPPTGDACPLDWLPHQHAPCDDHKIAWMALRVTPTGHA